VQINIKQKITILFKIVACFVAVSIIYGGTLSIKKLVKEDQIITSQLNKPALSKAVITDPEVIRRYWVVYDNLTFEELAAKLDRSLNSTLAGTGHLYAKYSLELGVDPYVAVAISLHETGCKWTCSSLVRYCNNVGGQKGGTTKCNGGSYRSFPTLEEGIYGFIHNLSINYYSKGLNTPELMNPKYAASPVWAQKVNSYVERVKAA